MKKLHFALVSILSLGLGLIVGSNWPIGESQVIASFVHDELTLIAYCRQTTPGTVSSYASVKLGTTEILTVMATPGHDLMIDCVRSSIDQLELDPSSNSLVMRMKNGETKLATIVGMSLKNRL